MRKENEKIKLKKTRLFPSELLMFFSVLALFVLTVPAQSQKWKTLKQAENNSDIPAEKSIKVAAEVNISLCVSAGKVKISGWERDEIRAFVEGGTKVGFRVMQQSKTGNLPVWVMVLGFEPQDQTSADYDECLSGDDIELDIPRGASIVVKSKKSEVSISTINKARVENLGGGIFLDHIAQGIDATTYEGDVTAENSGGAISLTAANGNIFAADVAPGDIGDVFKAKTRSGAINLQSIEHRSVEVSSATGSINFTGDLLNGGVYNLNTTNGSLFLNLPENASCVVNANIGLGGFNSDLPLLNVVKGGSNQVKKLNAVLGKGEAILNLTTYSGLIKLQKAAH